MEKRIVFLTLLIISNLFSKNIKQGTFEIRGSSSTGINFSQTKYDKSGEKSKIKSFDFHPSILYYIKSNLAIGTSLGIDYTVSKTDELDSTHTILFLAPTIKYSHSLNLNLNLFTDVSVLLYRTNIRFEAYDNYTSLNKHEKSIWDNSAGWSISTGVDYFIKDDFALTSKIKYMYLNDGMYDYNGVGDVKSLGLYFGLVYLIK